MGSLIVLHAYSLWPQTWVATGMQENERKRTSIALFLSLCAQVAPNVCLHIAICLIRSSFTTLLTGETTCPTPTVPMQLSPSWRGAQTDAVALAGESVTWSAMGYLHRARAAGGSGNEETVSHTHTHTHNWRRSATRAREWVQEKHALGGRWIVAESRHQSEHRGGQESSKSVVHTQTNTFTVWGANGSWSSSATPISTSLLTFEGPNLTVKSEVCFWYWSAWRIECPALVWLGDVNGTRMPGKCFLPLGNPPATNKA